MNCPRCKEELEEQSVGSNVVRWRCPDETCRDERAQAPIGNLNKVFD